MHASPNFYLKPNTEKFYIDYYTIQLPMIVYNKIILMGGFKRNNISF